MEITVSLSLEEFAQYFKGKNPSSNDVKILFDENGFTLTAHTIVSEDQIETKLREILKTDNLHLVSFIFTENKKREEGFDCEVEKIPSFENWLERNILELQDEIYQWAAEKLKIL